MRRRLLNLLTAWSLLMFVVVAVMAARALVTWDVLHVRLPRHVVFLSVSRGDVLVGGWSRGEHDPGPGGFLRHQSLTPAERERYWQAFVAPHVAWRYAGFYSAHDPAGDPKSKVSVGVPLWLPLVLLAAAPAARAVLFARRRRRQGRLKRGLCPACGYDVRATPDRCPECGTHPGDPPLAGGLARRSAAHEPT